MIGTGVGEGLGDGVGEASDGTPGLALSSGAGEPPGAGATPGGATPGAGVVAEPPPGEAVGAALARGTLTLPCAGAGGDAVAAGLAGTVPAARCDVTAPLGSGPAFVAGPGAGVAPMAGSTASGVAVGFDTDAGVAGAVAGVVVAKLPGKGGVGGGPSGGRRLRRCGCGGRAGCRRRR